MKTKIVTKKLSLSILALLVTLQIGCASTNQQAAGSAPVRQSGHSGLRVGMTYSEVARVLRPVDPGYDESVEDILEQERAATKDYKRALVELRAAGLQTTPKMNSQITVDGGDYILNFENRKLASWTLR